MIRELIIALVICAAFATGSAVTFALIHWGERP